MADENDLDREARKTTAQKVRDSMWEGGFGQAWDAAAPPAAPPAPPEPGWKINWPGVAMPGVGGSPFTFTPPAPIPPAPVGPADRRAIEAAPPPPPPPSAAPSPALVTGEIARPEPATGDERWEMNIPVPKSVGQAWEQRQPFPPGVAHGAVAALAPGASPRAVSALDIGGPEASLERFQRMEALDQEQERLYAEKEAELQPRRDAREALEKKMTAELAEYRKGIEAARPPKPELQKMPAVPDMKIRPWLDPEGKNALSVIAQTLAMVAVGVAGGVNRTPLTAMKYFREAAENWRRDEVDAANSKFKQFEASVQVIKNDNDVALTQYTIADKEYAHNIEAKKALVTSRLDELNLHDHALEATQKPYDEALAAVKARLASVATIQKSATDYLETVGKLTKGAAGLPKTPFGLGGFILEGKRQLADPNLDPAVRKDLEQKVPMAEQWLADHRKRAIDDAQTKSENVATVGIGKARLTKGDDLLRSAEYFESQLLALAQDYKQAWKGGGLPTDNTLIADWLAQARTRLTHLSPETQGALANIKKFADEIQVGTARTFLNDRGVQSIKAMGELGNQVMSYAAAQSVIARWNQMIKRAKQDAMRLRQEGAAILGTPNRGSLLAEPEPTEPETE